MKVTITLHLIVDRDKWASEYDIEPTDKAVREDVKTYFNAADIIPQYLAEFEIVRPA